MEISLLLKHLLPSELFEYFDLVDLKETSDNTLSFYLDEKNIKPQDLLSKELVSNGFNNPITIQDFPLREKRVYLIVRRRKWKDKETGNIYNRTWDLTAKGTSYSK
ncbi:ISAon1 family transposase N-terminal region protein [Sunxiuqinia sp. A32]|uniref:ISAon1 family transposase N-terminal region protein n=1 Tax=Sunxiuqinia sp. A32 TaxID=3461496 RepID=UPI0040460C61